MTTRTAQCQVCHHDASPGHPLYLVEGVETSIAAGSVSTRVPYYLHELCVGTFMRTNAHRTFRFLMTA